ncbi:hypothetical protein [Lentzea pudingi]|uniref:hypothetical protein n=1 Tax=Lentzea pudingi TaxID=1789439 RepID=UPI001667D0BD|nr:hypothetical protein [Lentzea pudingi]
MEISELSTDRLHEFAVYLAAAEAARETSYRIKIEEEGRRFRLEINGKLARVFARRTAQERPMRRGTQQDADGAHALVFVDLSFGAPAFYVTPADVERGDVEQYPGGWDRFAG